MFIYLYKVINNKSEVFNVIFNVIGMSSITCPDVDSCSIVVKVLMCCPPSQMSACLWSRYFFHVGYRMRVDLSAAVVGNSHLLTYHQSNSELSERRLLSFTEEFIFRVIYVEKGYHLT